MIACYLPGGILIYALSLLLALGAFVIHFGIPFLHIGLILSWRGLHLNAWETSICAGLGSIALLIIDGGRKD